MNLSLHELFEFANMYTKDTNIGTTIWIEEKTDKIKLKHSIRIKVMPKNNKMNINDACDVIFDKSGNIIEIKPNNSGQVVSGKILRNLQEWILLNHELLILHWNCKISTVEFMKKYESL